MTMVQKSDYFCFFQSLLRGRFLRNERPSEDDEERQPSVATREIGQLRQRHRVSGLRYVFFYHFNYNYFVTMVN